MVSDPGANARLSADDLPGRLDAKAVLLSGYVLFTPASEAAAVAALERASSDVVAVDAASWPLLETYGVERFLAVTRRATLILANEREASALTGVEGETAARALADRYPTACVKLGARGAALAGGGDARIVRAPPIEEVDPTGSGDAFDGTLLAAMARGLALEEAVEEAVAAGARAAAGREIWP